jgi:hypothetical protein
MKVELTDQERYVILRCIEIADHESLYSFENTLFPDGSDPSFRERITLLISAMEKLNYNEEDIRAIMDYIPD